MSRMNPIAQVGLRLRSTIDGVDTVTGEITVLEEGGSYTFSMNAMAKRFAGDLTPGTRQEVVSNTTRFKLLLNRGTTTDIPVEETTPQVFTLDQNFPNPFNPTTTIRFTLPESSNVRLAVYDLSGRQVAVLVSDRMNAGQHTVNFNGSSLASGVYIYRLDTPSGSLTRKMTLVK